jgi:hypothetical protein
LPWQQIGLKHGKYYNISDKSKRAENFYEIASLIQELSPL